MTHADRTLTIIRKIADRDRMTTRTELRAALAIFGPIDRQALYRSLRALEHKGIISVDTFAGDSVITLAKQPRAGRCPTCGRGKLFDER